MSLQPVLETPTKLRLPAAWATGRAREKLEAALAYEDQGITHEWRLWKKVQKRDDVWLSSDRARSRHWWIAQHGREALDAMVAELDAARHKSCLLTDEAGIWTYSGLAGKVAQVTGRKQAPERAYALPEPRRIAWDHAPEHTPRWYQRDGCDGMLARQPYGPASLEIGTGGGKSLIIAMLLKALGLPAVVMAPTLSIAQQLLKDLTRYFGKRHVGAFFDGKKEAEKLFTVAVSKSLTILAEDSPLWSVLRRKAVLIGDEAHMLPAETLARVVLGELGGVPYRFFLSGTQLRTDGLQIVLDGIIGDVVVRVPVRQLIEEKALSPLRFFQFRTVSDSAFVSDDAIKMNRVHLHQNPNVYAHAAKTARWGTKHRRPVMVLIEEVSQFVRFLQPWVAAGGDLRRIAFAHGGADKKQREELPEAFWKSDPMKLVEAFDAGAYDVLVGTGCVGMGTDVKSAALGIDIVGNKAEAQFRQRIGRLTRLFPGKTDAIYVDYNVTNVELLAKQAAVRRAVMDDVYGPVTTKEAL